jgi:hypothetical protein
MKRICDKLLYAMNHTSSPVLKYWVYWPLLQSAFFLWALLGHPEV